MILESIVLLSSLASSYNVGQLPKPNHYQQVLIKGIDEMDSRLVVCMSQCHQLFTVPFGGKVALILRQNIACA